jgi:hemoglobin
VVHQPLDRNSVRIQDTRMRDTLQFNFKQLSRLCLTVLLSLCTLSPVALARRRHHSRKKHAAIINEKHLYERLGGTKNVASIVDEWLRLSLADERISSFFAATTAKPERLAKFRRALTDQICEIADGPCQYNGPEMKKVHQDMHLEEEHFIAFADDLLKSLNKFSVGEREKNELLGRLGTMRAEILGLAATKK